MTSFKTTITGTELCNRALDLLPAEPISSLDAQVGGLNARTARRWYKPTVAWLLERHHWNLATVRSPLAEIANTRSTRWRYAYKMPSDAAFIFGLVGTDGIAQGLVNIFGLSSFERVGDIVYSNIAAAQIDHTSYQTTEVEFSEEFANVIVLMLASRFAMPIIKKPSVAQKYQQDGNDALVLAMARNANENQPTYGNTPSETELARGVGLNADLIWRGYALNPLLGQ